MKMTRNQSRSGERRHRFERGGDLGPIDDRNKFEQRLAGLPPDETELAGHSARLADLCCYFAARKIDIPSRIFDLVQMSSGSAMQDRIRILKRANEALMEYLNDVDENSRIEQ